MREWLKAIRLSKGIRVEVIAESTGITKSYYSMIEAGNRRPSVKLAKGLGSLLDFEWTRFFEASESDTLEAGVSI